MVINPRKARRYFQFTPWQQTLAVLFFVLLCAVMLVWSGLDQAGIQAPN
jgi:hypothetical protein